MTKSQFPAWQPIESAPKDGNEILGYYTAAGYHVYGVYRWDKTMRFWAEAHIDCIAPATHWMPLPEAPE